MRLDKPTHYYWIGSRVVNDPNFFGIQDPDWYNRAVAAGMECECGALNPLHANLAVDMDIVMEPPGFLVPARLAAVMRTDFYELLRPYLLDSIIGKTYLVWEDEDGEVERELYPDAVTCYTHPDATCSHRGARSSWYVYCRMCGNYKRGLARSPRYFLRRDTYGRHVIQSRHGDIFVSSSLYEHLDLMNVYPNLEVEMFGLRDDPIDGLVVPGDEAWDPSKLPADDIIE